MVAVALESENCALVAVVSSCQGAGVRDFVASIGCHAYSTLSLLGFVFVLLVNALGVSFWPEDTSAGGRFARGLGAVSEASPEAFARGLGGGGRE